MGKKQKKYVSGALYDFNTPLMVAISVAVQLLAVVFYFFSMKLEPS